jgi:hypothetical protein
MIFSLSASHGNERDRSLVCFPGGEAAITYIWTRATADRQAQLPPGLEVNTTETLDRHGASTRNVFPRKSVTVRCCHQQEEEEAHLLKHLV